MAYICLHCAQRRTTLKCCPIVLQCTETNEVSTVTCRCGSIIGIGSGALFRFVNRQKGKAGACRLLSCVILENEDAENNKDDAGSSPEQDEKGAEDGSADCAPEPDEDSAKNDAGSSPEQDEKGAEDGSADSAPEPDEDSANTGSTFETVLIRF